MGLIKGTSGLTRFIVEDPVPDDYMETFPLMIERYAFRNLDNTSDLERSAGWVNIMDMFDNDFTNMQYIKTPYLAMTYRIDVRRVPAGALRQYSLEAESKVLAMEGLEFLPKPRKKEIKEMTKLGLLKRAIPVSKTYDMVWNMDKGYLFFSGVNRKLCDEFSSFFSKCFNLRLGSVYPFLTASGFLKEKGMQPELLEELSYSITGGNR